MLVPVLCRGATVTLRHHSSLAGFVPPRDYAMTLFPLLHPKMAVAVVPTHAASFTSVDAGGAGVDQGSGQAAGRKPYPLR